MNKHSIKGGLNLEALSLGDRAELPWKIAALPETLIYPLQTKAGFALKPCVEPGQRVLKSQVLASGDAFNPPIHAATSGTVACIEARPLPHSGNFSGPCIVLNADGLDESLPLQGLEDPSLHGAQDLRERIYRAGILGMGGAGFPTSVKLDIKQRSIDCLIINGAECEPYYNCDDALMRKAPESILSGARIMKHMLKAERCFLAIKRDKLCRFESIDLSGIDIVALPDVYPIGAEKILIRYLTGREVPVGGIPADIGVICQNIATVEAIARAIVKGEPLTRRMVTVTGSGIAEPQNLWAAIGTPIAELVKQCAGYTPEAKRLSLGGPFMGFALSSDDVPITQATGLIWVDGFVQKQQASPCIRCGDCAAVCPMDLLPQQLYLYSLAENLDALDEHRLSACIECGCCDAVCPSGIPLVHHFRFAKGLIESHQKQRRQAEDAKLKYTLHQARKEREAQERAESLRRKKEALGK